MSKHIHRPRQSGSGRRQVLIPGTNRQSPHPWRDRLRAALDGKPTTKSDDAEVTS